MSAPWFVQPEVDVLELEWEGHPFKLWVKRDLTIGEERAMMKSVSKVKQAVKGGKGDGPTLGEAEGASADFDWTEYSFSRVLTYVTDWDMADDKGNKLKINRATISNFQRDLFEIIDNAIDQHATKQGELKNAKSPAKKSAKTSPSSGE